MVAVEYVSGYCVAFPVVYQTSETVVSFLVNLTRYFPCPKEIVSDNGTPFTAEATQDFAKTFNLKRHFSSKYYPQANSRVEKVNGLIKKVLKSVDPTMANWPIYVFRAVNVYNNSTTIFDTSPSQLLFGYSSFDKTEDAEISKYVKELFNDKQFHVNMIDAVILQLEKKDDREKERKSLVNKRFIARQNLKLLNDPKANHNTYSVGEYVQTKKLAKHHKTDPNFEGPFVISEMLDKNSYKITVHPVKRH